MLIGVLALAVALELVARKERLRVLIATVAFLACIGLLLLARLLESFGLMGAAQVARAVGLLGGGIAIIYLAGIAVFRALLPLAGLNTPRILQDVVTAVAYFVWMLVWLHWNRVNLTGIVATSAVMTAVIGLSLQDTLGNILGGLAIQLDQSIQVGDWIRVDDQVGQVVEIRWRSTSIETSNGETVVIPNSQLVRSKFLVLGRRQGQPLQWRRTVTFNVDFRCSPTRVIETVETAIRAASIPHVSSEPPPSCLLLDFTDSYCRYGVRYWLTELSADSRTDSEVRTHVYFALRRAGIPLSIPAQAVFVTEETSERKASKHEEAIARRAEALRRIDLFKSLHPEEIQRLATRLVPAPFTEGEVMSRQGAEAHWLYLIVDGRADVMVAGEKGRRRKVAELGPGEVFGEMGLMTGEPRTATVIARTDVDCYRLDKEAFQDIVRQRPGIAQEISRIIAERRAELDAALQALDAEARAREIESASRAILDRIRAFFGLDN